VPRRLVRVDSAGSEVTVLEIVVPVELHERSIAQPIDPRPAAVPRDVGGVATAR